MEKKKMFQIRLTESEKRELKRLAKSENRSMASYVVNKLKLNKGEKCDTKTGKS